jgi:hypothetical protein
MKLPARLKLLTRSAYSKILTAFNNIEALKCWQNILSPANLYIQIVFCYWPNSVADQSAHFIERYNLVVFLAHFRLDQRLCSEHSTSDNKILLSIFVYVKVTIMLSLCASRSNVLEWKA